MLLIDSANSAKHLPFTIGIQVDFDKGCYLGQEILARVNFLGRRHPDGDKD